MLSRATYLDSLERDSQAFADLLRDHDLATAVPDCPGWSLGDLARHLSGVHRWARSIVITGEVGEEPEGPHDGGALHDWFVTGVAELLDTLRAVALDTPVWTFGPRPRTAAFWVRRQPHETSMHLGDARRAVGVVHHVDAELAADGVDEVATIMTPRQVRLGRIPPLAHGIRIVLRDAPGEEHVLAGDCTDPAAATVATVTGSAQDVLHALWRRPGIDRLWIDGDADAARATLALALTP